MRKVRGRCGASGWSARKVSIVHGHWARRGYYRGPRTLGLDSGCVYGGPLTAWCVEEDRIVQVQRKPNFRDNEEIPRLDRETHLVRELQHAIAIEKMVHGAS